MESAQLKELLAESNFISQQLAKIKEDVVKEANYHDNPQKPPSEYLEDAINLRQAFRMLADGIEAKRMLAQLQKEKIERGKIYLEGLQYYKTTLQAKIAESQIDVLDLEDYLEEPIGEINWTEDYALDQTKIKHDLEKKKEKKQIFEEKVKQKMKIQDQYKQKNELYQKIMPNHVKKLHDQILETAKMFNIEQIEKPDIIESKQLLGVYNMFTFLRNKQLVQITYSKDQFEEIEIVINKTDHRLYKIARHNKIQVQEENIKFVVASLKPNFGKLVIGVDRREDFSTQEVFGRLIYNQKAKDVFSHPQNEFQRNMNKKYVHIDWIESVLACRILDGQSFLNLIRERVFCLQMIKSILQNMKKLSFFFPLTAESEIAQSINLKKVNVVHVDRIKFEQFISLSHVPSWVKKYLTTFSIIQSEFSQKTLEYQMGNQIDRRNIDQILKILDLEEFQDKDLNSYYKVTINVYQNTTVFVIILPFGYPKYPSKIKLIECKRKEDERQNQREINFGEVPCKLSYSSQGKRIFTDRMGFIEKSVNEGITQFIKGETLNSFRLLFQINRLICLLSDGNSEKKI